MYTTEKISPSELHLDEQNPRFRISMNPSQEEIREYMLVHEKALRLASKMAEMNTVLPGERVIIFKENNMNIVLEGNRRTCCYQMFLNRNLIPAQYTNTFPLPSDKFLSEIQEIDVDVVQTREEAMAYLAARHIEGVNEWSSVSKWRISHEYYAKGTEISRIAEILVCKQGDIKKFIRQYKILLRGINNPEWTSEEKQMLNPLSLKPDKLIRLFNLKETTNALGLSYDDNHNLISSYLDSSELSKIIAILTRKAFIENAINTRSDFSNIRQYIQPILDLSSHKQPSQVGDIIEANIKTTSTIKDIDNSSIFTDNSIIHSVAESEIAATTNNSITDSQTKTNTKSNRINIPIGTGGNANLPYFFQGLQYGHLTAEDPTAHGIIRVCNEVQKFTKKRMVKDFPLCAAFLTRALIEHSIIYYSKTHKIQGQDKLIWSQVSRDGKAPELSKIISIYNRNLPNYITDSELRGYFTNLFADYDDKINPLNWVIHRPAEFQLNPDSLCSLPSQGLLVLINYLISKSER